MTVPPPFPPPGWAPPAPPPPPQRGRQVTGLVLAVAAPLLVVAAVWAWLGAGGQLVEGLNRSLSGNEPTTSTESPGGAFLELTVLGVALWGTAVVAGIVAIVVGRDAVRVVAILSLVVAVAMGPLLLLALV